MPSPRDGLTPAERTLRSRVAAHKSWENTTNPTARTAPGRAAFLDRFERQIDPDGTLPPAERAKSIGGLMFSKAGANPSSQTTTSSPTTLAKPRTDDRPPDR